MSGWVVTMIAQTETFGEGGGCLAGMPYPPTYRVQLCLYQAKVGGTSRYLQEE
jgi:hypothetical protein